MDMYPGYVVKQNVATIRMDTGVKQQPFDKLRAGLRSPTHQSTERSNPLSALGFD